MISLEYEKFQERVEADPLKAAHDFQDHIERNVRARQSVIKLLSEKEQKRAARETFFAAQSLAEKLLEEADDDALETWYTDDNDETISTKITTHSLGSYVLTRFADETSVEYDIFIHNENLDEVLAELKVQHPDKDIDRVAVIEESYADNRRSRKMAEAEWGFELLMHIALDRVVSRNNSD
jgi:hypothetical protein